MLMALVHPLGLALARDPAFIVRVRHALLLRLTWLVWSGWFRTLGNAILFALLSLLLLHH